MRGLELIFIAADGKTALVDGQRIGWKKLIEYISDRSPENIRFEYQWNSQDDNEDLLSNFLDFCMLGILCISNYDVKKIVLRVEVASEDQNIYYKVKSKLENFFKGLGSYQEKIEIFVHNHIKNELLKNISDTTHSYLPIIPVDNNNYENIFCRKIKTIDRAKEVLSNVCDPQSTSIAGSQAGFLLQFIAETLNADAKSERSRRNIAKIIEDYLMDCDLFTACLACTVYRRFKKNNINNAEAAVEEYDRLFKCARIYSLGIKEIVENILKHTELKKGLVYFRLHNKRNASELRLEKDYFVKAVASEKNQAYMNCLEIFVMDYNSEGILDTYEKNGGCSNIALDSIYDLDKNIYWGLETISGPLEHSASKDSLLMEKELANLLFHKGLKIFKEHVINSRGYFSITTCRKGTTGLSHTDYYNKPDKMPVKTMPSDERPGTSYRVILPILSDMEFLSDRYNHTSGAFQTSARGNRDGVNFFSELTAFITQSKALTLHWDKAVADKIFSGFSEHFDAETCCRVISEIISCFEIRQGSCDKLDAEIIYIDFANIPLYNIGNVAEKLIYYYLIVFTYSKVDYIVFFNLDKNVIQNYEASYYYFFDTYKNVGAADQMYIEAPWIFMYDLNGAPTIFRGQDKDKNRIYQNYYYNARMLLSNTSETNYASLSAMDKKSILFPLEVLTNGSGFPIFLAHLRQIISTDIYSDNFGIKHEEHVKLGSKIHVNTFYQAKLIFENSYYTDCLAYVLSQCIIQEKPPSDQKLIIVGYKIYSEMLIKKIKKLLESTMNVQCITMIYHDEYAHLLEEISQLGSIDFKAYRFVFVVPVASTLKTFNKIFADVIRGLPFSIRQDNVMNFTLIELRDDNTVDGSGTTRIEREQFDWVFVNDKKNLITIKGDAPFSEKKHIHYIICEKTSWLLSTACDVCGTSSSPLLNTEDSSLALSTNVGLPYNVMGAEDMDDYISYRISERSKADAIYSILSENMYYGHFNRNGTHFIYYFDDKKFLRHLLESPEKATLKQWVSVVKDQMEKQCSGSENKVGCVNILLIPEHYSNIEFAEYIFEYLFDRNGIIIRENFINEFYSNFRIKYNFIIRNNNIRFYYIDDIVNTGRTFLKTVSLIGESIALGNEIYMITLINRLDYQNYYAVKSECKKIFSFVRVYVPLMEKQDDRCCLCDEIKLIESIKSNTITVKNRIKEKQDKLALKSDIQNDLRTKPYIKERFLLINYIYYLLFSNENEIGKGKDIKKLKKLLGIEENRVAKNILGLKEVGLSYKINLVKVLSNSFLSKFSLIMHAAFDLCIAECESLLSQKPVGDRKLQADYLTVLIKQLVRLNAYYLISKENIKRIWLFINCQNGEEYSDYFNISYICCISRLMLYDQVASYMVARNVLELLEETRQNEERQAGLFKEFLIALLIENDYIFSKALESYNKDNELIEITKTEMINQFFNYYYLQANDYLKLFFESQIGEEECRGKLNNILFGINELMNFVNKDEEDSLRISETTSNQFPQAVLKIYKNIIKEILGNSGAFRILLYYNNGKIEQKPMMLLYDPEKLLKKWPDSDEVGFQRILDSIWNDNAKQKEYNHRCRISTSDCAILRKYIFATECCFVLNFQNEGPKRCNGFLLLLDKASFNMGTCILLYKALALSKDKIYRELKYFGDMDSFNFKADNLTRDDIYNDAEITE